MHFQTANICYILPLYRVMPNYHNYIVFVWQCFVFMQIMFVYTKWGKSTTNCKSFFELHIHYIIYYICFYFKKVCMG